MELMAESAAEAFASGADAATGGPPPPSDAPADPGDADPTVGHGAPEVAAQPFVGLYDDFDPVGVALAGVGGSGGALPFLDLIQRAFGRHDVTGVSAHSGDHAQAAAGELGAGAYAVGDRVGFGSAPSLHTVAHEAAHVIQQRAGVSLLGGMGEADDAYERHADAVADRVVRGQSAEALLDEMSGGRAGGQGARNAVQRELRVFGVDERENPASAEDTFRIGEVAALRSAVTRSLCSRGIPRRHHRALREWVTGNAALGQLAQARQGQRVKLRFTFTWSERGEFQSATFVAQNGAYNPTRDEDGAATGDAERPTGSSRLVREGGQWNGREIARNWSQLDDHPSSFHAAQRCGYQSTLIVHINSGFDAVRRVAADTAERLSQYREQGADQPGEASGKANLCRMMARTPMARWQYNDLDALAEGMYLLGQRGSSAGTDSIRMARVENLGTTELDSQHNADGGEEGPQAASSLRGYEDRAFTGRAGFDEISRVLTHYRDVGMVINVPSLNLQNNQRLGHAVTFGVDGDGQRYLYDPWPRQGSQQLYWPSNQEEILAYFTGRWRVLSVVGGADEDTRHVPSHGPQARTGS